MFGERYFATRDRLVGLIHNVIALAAETDTDICGQLKLDEVNLGLCVPFYFVVLGEVNAGKSTMINGLCGSDLCRVNALPETNRVCWYRFGKPACEIELSPLLDEIHRPLLFLRDFNVIDTPGTNAMLPAHREAIARFLPVADVLFFVFPVTNPWCAATWNLISELSPDLLKRVVLIIQQSDLREAIDIKVIFGHMADLAIKRIGHVPRMYAVSGKNSHQAKSVSPRQLDILRESGYLELEKFISDQICNSLVRKALLEEWYGKTAEALRAIEDCLEKQTHELHEHGRFLDTIEREIDGIREKFVMRLPRHLVTVAEVFETEAVWVSKRLRRRIGAFRSFIYLFLGDRTGPAIEAVFVDRLQGAVEAVAETDGLEVVEFCRNHWTELGERVKTTMDVDLGSLESLNATLEIAQKSFVQRLGRAAYQGIDNLKVRNQLDKDLRSRNVALKSFTFTTLVFLTIGAVCGALGISWLPVIFCSLAGAFFLGGIIVASMTRRTITSDFQRRLLDTCGGFASALHADYEEALRIVFQDYASSLNVVRSQLASDRLSIEPRLRKWQELFLTLKAVGQDI